MAKLTEQEAWDFLAELEVLYRKHGIVCSAGEPIHVYRIDISKVEGVRDRTLYKSADPDDGDMQEFGSELYVNVDTALLAVNRIRRNMGWFNRYAEW